MNLVLSLVALALGPLLYGACQKKDIVRSALDGLLFVTIVGIVVVHIVPDVLDAAGPVSLMFLAAGVAFAFFVERWPAAGDSNRYSWIILLGGIGLVIHATMDGIALLPSDRLHGSTLSPSDVHAHETTLAGLFENHLALGVILHRIPVGMAIWWTVRPRLGRTVALAALTVIAAATSAAYVFGDSVVALMEATSVACFQAFVAGTLLHVIVFTSVRRSTKRPEPLHTQTDNVVGERLGIVAGLILVFMVPHAH